MDRIDSRLSHSPEPASDDVASPFNLPPVEAKDRLAFEPVPLRHRRDGLTPQKQREYVEALADTGLVREAAARVGISEQAISRVRRRSDARDFDRACEAAQMFGARRLRSIAWERAIEGTLKGHYYHGELVSEERVFDNRLLIYLLGKTEHFLQPSAESLAVCEHWEPCMEALEQGLPAPQLVPCDPDEEDRRIEEEEDPEVWLEDETWWTFFPPPEGFDGEEEGDLGDEDYRRTLTEDEVVAMEARDRIAHAAALAPCCAARDRYFGLPPRGAPDFFRPRGSRNNETSEPFASPSRSDGEGNRAQHGGAAESELSADRVPEPPVSTPLPLHHARCGPPPRAADGQAATADDSSSPTSKPPSPGILAGEPPGEPT